MVDFLSVSALASAIPLVNGTSWEDPQESQDSKQQPNSRQTLGSTWRPNTATSNTKCGKQQWYAMWTWTKHQTIRPQAIQISLHLRDQNENQQTIQDIYMSEIEITYMTSLRCDLFVIVVLKCLYP